MYCYKYNKEEISFEIERHGMSCRNICIELKAKKSFHTIYYEDGLRRCTECEIFYKMEWYEGPCCGAALRIKSHDAKVRRKLSKTRKFVCLSYRYKLRVLEFTALLNAGCAILHNLLSRF